MSYEINGRGLEPMLKNADSPILDGVSEDERASFSACLCRSAASYDRGEYICRPGETLMGAGLVAQGAVSIIDEDYWGNRSILFRVNRGGLFGAAFSLAESGVFPFAAVAGEDTRVLWLDREKLSKRCERCCPGHARIQENMLAALARRNIDTLEKLTCISKRTTREKLLAYLSTMAIERGAAEFCIPFNRQELADYLSVDRSAMCSELGRMREDGLISFKGSRFKVLSGSGRENA